MAVLILFVGASFVGALVSPWRWAFLPLAILAVLLGKRADDEAGPNDDMPNLGLAVGIFTAIIVVVVWLLGRWVRHRARSTGDPD